MRRLGQLFKNQYVIKYLNLWLPKQVDLPLTDQLWSGNFILQTGQVHNSTKPLFLGPVEMFTDPYYLSLDHLPSPPAIFVLKFVQSTSDYYHLTVAFSQFFLTLCKNVLLSVNLVPIF